MVPKVSACPSRRSPRLSSFPLVRAALSATCWAGGAACRAAACLTLSSRRTPHALQESYLLRQRLSISEALAGAPSGREVALALLEAERMLAQQEGCLKQEWKDVWQGPWRRCGVKGWVGGWVGGCWARAMRQKHGGIMGWRKEEGCLERE
jgi:hypothetical protein